MPSSEPDLELALDAARAAGRTVLRFFGTDLQVAHKTPDQPLTAADLAADAQLKDILVGARPGYGWLSEETQDHPDRLSRRRVWIVDPIDGTRSFIAGRPEFAISIGLVEQGEPLIGVVYNPAREQMFYAVRGGGAFLENGAARAALEVSRARLDDQLRMLASRSEIAAGELDPFSDWRIQPVGSTAYKLACVAAGHGEAFVSRGPKSEWDVCAGVLIVGEAGGRVTDLEGSVPRFNCPDPHVHGILATNSVLHDTLLQRIADLPAPGRLRRGARDPLHPGLKKEQK